MRAAGSRSGATGPQGPVGGDWATGVKGRTIPAPSPTGLNPPLFAAAGPEKPDGQRFIFLTGTLSFAADLATPAAGSSGLASGLPSLAGAEAGSPGKRLARTF